MTAVVSPEVSHKKNQVSRQFVIAWTVTGAVVGTVLGFSGGLISGTLAQKTNNDDSTKLTSQTLNLAKDDGNRIVSKDEQSIDSLVEKVSPSVVSIITTVRSGSVLGQEAQAAGTGMVVSKNGYVLTNKHVVDGAVSATIIFSDGRKYDNVPVIGVDPLNDVAFLKIPHVDGLPAVAIGDSKTVRVGQSVVAIGNALGQYQNTVTTGIISGIGRPIQASLDESNTKTESLVDLIQTDAAINSGNSGGPLLNMQGQVIGMNTAIAEDAQGIGFAIPIGSTKGMLTHLLATGTLQRAVAGLQYVSITPEVKSHYNLSADYGDYVVAVSGSAVKSGGPADKAGIKEKDIITKVNDIPVGAGKSISTLIGEYQAGDTVKITLLRNGAEQVVSLTLGAY